MLPSFRSVPAIPTRFRPVLFCQKKGNMFLFSLHAGLSVFLQHGQAWQASVVYSRSSCTVKCLISGASQAMRTPLVICLRLS